LSATISGPTNGRLELRLGLGGFGFSFMEGFCFDAGFLCGSALRNGIGYAGLLSFNLDLSATASGPTNGRLDCASIWDGFGFSFHGRFLF
jgi:hypothetical protein